MTWVGGGIWAGGKPRVKGRSPAGGEPSISEEPLLVGAVWGGGRSIRGGTGAGVGTEAGGWTMLGE